MDDQKVNTKQSNDIEMNSSKSIVAIQSTSSSIPSKKNHSIKTAAPTSDRLKIYSIVDKTTDKVIGKTVRVIKPASNVTNKVCDSKSISQSTQRPKLPSDVNVKVINRLAQNTDVKTIPILIQSKATTPRVDTTMSDTVKTITSPVVEMATTSIKKSVVSVLKPVSSVANAKQAQVVIDLTANSTSLDPVTMTTTTTAATDSASENGDTIKTTKSNENINLTKEYKTQLEQEYNKMQSKMTGYMSKEVAEALKEFKNWQTENDPDGRMSVGQLNKKLNEFMQRCKPVKLINKSKIETIANDPNADLRLLNKRKTSLSSVKSLDLEENAVLKRVKMSSSRSSSCDSSTSNLSSKTTPESNADSKEESNSFKRSVHDSLYFLLRADASNYLQKRKAANNKNGKETPVAGTTANGSSKIQIRNGKLMDPNGPIRVLEPTTSLSLEHVIPKEEPMTTTSSKSEMNTNFLGQGLTAKTKARRLQKSGEIREKLSEILASKNPKLMKYQPQRTANGRSKSLSLSNGNLSVTAKPRFRFNTLAQKLRDLKKKKNGNAKRSLAIEMKKKKTSESVNNFLGEMIRSISWSDQNSQGNMKLAAVKFRRNEFGLIEVANLRPPEEEDIPMETSSAGTTKPRIDIKYAESRPKQCFDNLIKHLSDSSIINDCKPHEYYSQEFQSMILSMLKNGNHHGNLLKAKEIVEAMANVSESSTATFDWNKIVDENNENADNDRLQLAPQSMFANPYPCEANTFKIGEKLEAIDPHNSSSFCVCTVVALRGNRIKLHFDGYRPIYDFWTYIDSWGIFPVGWCNKTGRDLQPPARYDRHEDFDWATYLKETKSVAADKDSFKKSALYSLDTNKNPFKIGLKIEADDIRFTRKICVATIGDVIGSRILVTFDGFDDSMDYWTEITSPYIHPVNWHLENGFSITFPPNWSESNFEWDRYLNLNRAESVPESAFCTRNPIEFETGMALEIVDKKNPTLIRPAKILMTYEYEIKVLFIGWHEEYAYWIDDDSADIHPPGWCKVTSHPIEPPPKPGNKLSGCGVHGCRGIGFYQRSDLHIHNTREDCPYYRKNWKSDDFWVFGQTRIDAKSRIVHDGFNVGAPAYRMRTPAAAVADTKTQLSLQPLLNPAELAGMAPKDVEMFRRLQVSTSFLLSNAQKLSKEHNKWLNRIEPLKKVQISAARKNPLNWTIDEVVEFVTSLPNCSMVGTIFREHEIDGLAFLALRQNDMIDIMGLSLGSAIKIFNRIIWLREDCNAHYIRYD